MRTDIPASFQGRVRKIGARVRVARDHPVWSPLGYDTFGEGYDCFSQTLFAADVVRQYGLAQADNAVYMAQIDLGQPIYRTFIPWGTLPATPDSPEYRDISAAGTALWCAVNGVIYRCADATNNDFVWEQVASFYNPVTNSNPKISLSAMDANTAAVAVVTSGETVPDHCKIAVITIGDRSGVDYWDGYLPRSNTRPRIAAFGTGVGGRDNVEGSYIRIYIDDWSGKMPVMLTRYAPMTWSASSEILPMDALDDESSFSIGYYSQVAGRHFLTGTLQRRYGPSYSIYILGPDNFSFGRDLIIQSGSTDPMCLFTYGTNVYALGQVSAFWTDAQSSIFTPESTGTAAEVLQFTLERSTNQPDHLGLEVPISEAKALPLDLIPGARVDLEVTADGQEFVKMGQFGISRTLENESDADSTFSVDCLGHALKRMMDWESDTYFDYLGQGEVHGDPGDLTKLVRVSGADYKSENGLRMEGLNTDGVLYTTPPASHGGFLSCRFTNVQSTGTMVGVGLNYGEETLAQAAERLGKKMEQVTAGERAKWGLFAIFTPNDNAGGSRVMLVDYNTIRVGTTESPTSPNPFFVLKSVSVEAPTYPATIRVAMSYQDGLARVYYNPVDTGYLSLVVKSEAQSVWDIHPTEHDHYGRGAIFLRNNTGFHMSYPVMSDSDVVPLYHTYDRWDKFGIPLEEKEQNFPASGTVKIDSEYLQYSGIAGLNEVKFVNQDLNWLPGKIIGKSADGINTPTVASNVVFARSRGTRTGTHVHGNNYLLQAISPAAGTHLTAIRIFLKKANYPEDGLLLTVTSGSFADNWMLVSKNTVLAQASISSAQLKEEGSWVTFYLSQSVEIQQSVYNAGKQYWIVLKRQRNPNHPSSASYFVAPSVAGTAYSGGNLHVFCEEDDYMWDTSYDLAMVLYGRVDDLNKEYLFPVTYKSGAGLQANAASEYWTWDPAQNEGAGGYVPTALQNYWKNCALTITDGGGKNNCYRIVRSFRLTDSLNDLFVFAVERDPGRIFDPNTKARAVPALYGLKRGVNDLSGNRTLPAAHGSHAMVHLPTNLFATASNFSYFTAEEDLTVAEVAEMIARKAGVERVDLSNTHPGEVLSTGMLSSPTVWTPARSRNIILLLDLPMLDGSNEVCRVQFQNAGTNVLEVLVGKSYAFNPYNQVKGFVSLGVPGQSLLRLPYNENIKGTYRISLYNSRVSVWLGGRILGALPLDTHPTWDRVGIGLSGNNMTAKVLIPEAGTRVDNFVMDMGKSGASLLSTLIGEKRIYFRENKDGVLKIFTDRESVPGVYSRVVSRSLEKSDSGMATRVLLEGGEVVEVASGADIAQYGNFFKTFNFHEINNLDDAAYFADVLLEDMTLNREVASIQGAVDPRIEPTDVLDVQVSGTTRRYMVVDGIMQNMRVDDNDVVYDMNLSGRYKPEVRPL